MTGMNKIAAAFLMLAAGFSAAEARSSSAVTVKAEIDSAQLTMGDRAHLLVTVDMPDAVTSTAQLVDFPVLTPGKEYMEFHGVDVVASDSVSSSSNGRTRINFDFTIQAFDPGTVTIPPFAVVASPGADTAFSTVVALKVLPVDVDSLQTIHPMASVASPQSRWYDYVPDWLFWTLLAVVLAAAGVWAFMMLRQRKQIIEEQKAAPVPPYDLAKSRLNSLRSRKLAENGHEKQYYTELTDILRQYLQGRFGINAMEMTSTQIVRALRSNPETRMTADEMRAVLSIADFVKFAKVRPMPDDNAKAFAKAESFVEQTKPKPEPEPEEAGEGAAAAPAKVKKQ